jgi:oligoendopeptidase F
MCCPLLDHQIADGPRCTLSSELPNYLYAGVLAATMFDMVNQDPAAFQKRYTQLLREGFYAPPEQLLRTFFGRDLSPQQVVNDDMVVLERRIKALADVYRVIEKKHKDESVV